jgi:hypothetical protein
MRFSAAIAESSQDANVRLIEDTICAKLRDYRPWLSLFNYGFRLNY